MWLQSVVQKTTAVMDLPAGVVPTRRRGEERVASSALMAAMVRRRTHATKPGLLGRTQCVDVKEVEGACVWLMLEKCGGVVDGWVWQLRPRGTGELPPAGWGMVQRWRAGATSAENGAFHWDRVQRTPKE